MSESCWCFIIKMTLKNDLFEFLKMQALQTSANYFSPPPPIILIKWGLVAYGTYDISVKRHQGPMVYICVIRLLVTGQISFTLLYSAESLKPHTEVSGVTYLRSDPPQD